MRTFFAGVSSYRSRALGLASTLALACLVACSGARSDEIASECITDRQCGSGSICESGRCTSTTQSAGAHVTGKIAGAPDDISVETRDADGIDCELREGKGLVCELAPGGRVTLVAPEVEGHRFAGWSGDAGCKGDAPELTLKKVARNTTCTANYTRRFRVTGAVEGEAVTVLALSESATAVCDGATCEVDLGETVVLAAPERDGYRISSFDGEGCGAREGYRVTVVAEASDVTCTATYIESLTVRGQAQGLSEADAVRPESQIRAEALVESALCEGQLCAIDPDTTVVLTAPEIEGYRFRGWTGDAPCLSGEFVVQLDGVNTNVVCTADYVARHTVTGVSEGTEAPITSLSENLFSVCEGPSCVVDRGESVTLQAGTVEGYRLKEWTGEGCEALSGASAIVRNVESDVTCTAHYVEGVSVTGTVVNAEGEVEALSDSPGADCGRGSCAIDLNGSVTLTAPRLPGRTFLGWSGDEGCRGTDLTLVLSEVTSSKSCNATFAARFTVTARPEPARGGSVTATSAAPNASCVGGTRCEVDEGSTVVFTATPNPNFRFTGWSGGGPCVGSQPRLDLRAVAASVTCSANFVARIKVSSSAAPAAGGTTTASQLSLTAECQRTTCTVDAGTNVLLTATPAEGYLFTRWSGCGSPFNPLLNQATLLVIGATSDEACVANFEKKKYPVTAVAGDGGRVGVSAGLASCAGGSCTVEHGGSATFSATAEPSHDFVGWTGCSIIGNTVGNITAPVTCTATFKIKSVKLTGTVNAPYATVQATSSSPGNQCSSNVCTVNYGGSVTLTVGDVDPEGYRFSNWIACPGASINGRSLTVSSLTSSYTCTANYTQIPRYTVTVRTVGPGESGCVGSCTVYEGGTVTLTTKPGTPMPNYMLRWGGWSCTGNESVSASFTVDDLRQNVTCTATFFEDPVPLL